MATFPPLESSSLDGNRSSSQDRNRKEHFAIVRPYDDAFRRRVLVVLDSLGFAPGEVCPPGTPNVEAAAFLESQTPLPAFVLLPYHQHNDTHGDAIDGVDVAMRYPERYIMQRIPIVMPVSAFAYASSCPRRLDELAHQHPEIRPLVLALPPEDFNADALRPHLEARRR